MGFGSILLGHSTPEIQDAIKAQLDQSWSVGAINPQAGVLAEELSKITQTDRIAFFNSGTEAIMVAIRIARAATRKNKIVFFRTSYHGTFDSLLTLKNDRKTQQAQALIPGITQSMLNESYLLDYGSEEAIKFIDEHAEDIAAVLIEPVQSRNPSLQPKAFLKEIRKICTCKNVALIFDEVITGFRIGLGGAQAFFDVQADIVTYGKVIGGGLPIGVVAGKSMYLDMLDGGYWQFGDDSAPKSRTTFVAGTFCHHPLAMVSALKILEILQRDNGRILEDLNTKTAMFCDSLNQFFKAEKFPIKIDYFGSLFRFRLNPKYKSLYQKLLSNGIYIWEGRNCFLSPAHTADVMEKLEDIIKLSCHQVKAQLS